MENKEFKTLAEVLEALQAEFAKKAEADLAIIESLTDRGIELSAQEAVAAATAELEEEVTKLKGKAADPQEARIAKINDGKSMKLVVNKGTEEKPDNYEIEVRFTVQSFSVPGYGDLKAADVVAHPERYGAAIQKLLNRGAKVLRIESEKKVKAKTKK